MPEPLDPIPMQPLDSTVAPIQQHLADEVARKASQGGGGTFSGVVDGAEIVGDVIDAAVSSADVAGTVFETVGSAAEVSGHVLSGALDVLGSAGDLAGCLDGCSGCSTVIAFIVVLAAAGSAFASIF